MCDCIKLVSKALEDVLLTIDNVKSVSSVEIPQVFGRDNQVLIPITVQFVQKLKNGKEKTVKGNRPILAHFCPFCGEKYPLL